MQALRSILDAEIERQGAISFARFMEIALYTPDLGYYECYPAVGKNADFYTSVSVGSLFAELLAWQFTRWLQQLNSPRIQLIEAAAHNGQLAFDILGWFKQHEPSLFERIDYIILEPSPALQSRQGVILNHFQTSLRWIKSWRELAAKQNGIIFSNELLDAFPTHIIEWQKDAHTWRELGVTFRDTSYTWTPLPPHSLSPERFPQLPVELLDVLPDGFKTEVNPAASAWWQAAANALQTGWLMTIDYGLESDEFFTPHRAHGTVRTYQKHRPANDPLANPGEQDITSQVDFGKLRTEGELYGLRTVHDLSQARFFTKIVEHIGTDPTMIWTAARLRQFQTLTHPDHLGRPFRVLVQQQQRAK